MVKILMKRIPLLFRLLILNSFHFAVHAVIAMMTTNPQFLCLFPLRLWQ
jgi:hypothetical protein